MIVAHFTLSSPLSHIKLSACWFQHCSSFWFFDYFLIRLGAVNWHRTLLQINSCQAMFIITKNAQLYTFLSSQRLFSEIICSTHVLNASLSFSLATYGFWSIPTRLHKLINNLTVCDSKTNFCKRKRGYLGYLIFVSCHICLHLPRTCYYYLDIFYMLWLVKVDLTNFQHIQV